jgi:hypothetical protein
MVGPVATRAGVAHLEAMLELSERRARSMIFKPVVFDQFRAAGDTLLTGSEASASRAASTPEIGFDLTIAGHLFRERGR